MTQFRDPDLSGLQMLPYTPELIPAALALAAVTLGDSGAVRKTEAFWRWKHEENPCGRSYGLVAWDEAAGRPAGLRLLLRWEYRDAAGRAYRAVRAVDTATHPDYQRRGLFTALTRRAVEELAQEGVDFIFNTPNKKSLPGYLKMGWQVVATWPMLIAPLRPWRMLSQRIRGGSKSPSPGESRAAPPRADWFGPDVLSWEEFEQRYGDQAWDLAGGWEAGRRQVGLRTARTAAYLHWRYGGHPNVQYGVLPCEAAGAPGRLESFAVLRPNLRRGWREVVVSDLFVRRGTGDGRRLLRALRRAVRGDYLIAHAAHGTVERQALRRAGFLPLPRQGMVFTVRPLQDGGPRLDDPAAWDLTLGDLEVF